MQVNETSSLINTSQVNETTGKSKTKKDEWNNLRKHTKLGNEINFLSRQSNLAKRFNAVIHVN